MKIYRVCYHRAEMGRKPVKLPCFYYSQALVLFNLRREHVYVESAEVRVDDCEIPFKSM